GMHARGLWGTPLPLDQTEYVKNLGLICQVSTIVPTLQALGSKWRKFLLMNRGDRATCQGGEPQK
ncbi:MAG: hypothetical protein ABUK15_11335, partial [Anaerolineales bacterium]